MPPLQKFVTEPIHVASLTEKSPPFAPEVRGRSGWGTRQKQSVEPCLPASGGRAAGAALDEVRPRYGFQ